MAKIRLLIADRNKEYGRALGRAISGMHPDIRITEKPAEEIFGIDGQSMPSESILAKWDLILGNEEEACVNMKCGGNVIGLSDRVQASFEKEGCLYRYAGVSVLVAALRFRFQQLGGDPFSAEPPMARKTEWISFYSGAGGSGKTAAALGIARFLALERNSRILYLSLEEPDATSFYFGRNPAIPSASQLLYHFEEWSGRQDFSRRMIPFLQKDDCGVETFYGGESKNEFAQLERDEMEQLQSSLRDLNRFEYIFVDLPGGFSDLTLFSLTQSHGVVFVESCREESRYKAQKAQELLDRLWEHDGGPKRIRVCSDSTGQGTVQGLSEGMFYLPYDPESFSVEENRVRIHIHKEFGKGVKKIAEQLECGWETAR